MFFRIQHLENNNGPQYQKGFKDGQDKVRQWLRSIASDDPQTIQQKIRDAIGHESTNTPVQPTPPPPQSADAQFLQGVFGGSTSTATPAAAHKPIVDKATIEQRNQNVLLFAASLLLVAAAAAFVGTTMSDFVKLAGIWIAVGAFYGIGMWLHQNEKLRPAAIAFIGISLGALPFAGIALYQLADISAPHSWMITSLVGVAAYFYAAIRLQSQVVSYLTLAFIVSFAASFGESLSLSVMWSFVIVIAVSLLFNLIAFIRPGWVPAVFAKPIDDTSDLLTPLALGASILLMPRLSIVDYQVIVGVATAQYVVMWLQKHTYDYELVVRILAHVFVALFAWDLFGRSLEFGLVLVIAAMLQQGYALSRYASRDLKQSTYELGLYFALQITQFFAMLFYLRHDFAAEFTALTLLLIGISSLAMSLRSRAVVAAIPGLIASVWLPILLARSVLEPSLDWAVVAGIFLAFVAAITYLWPQFVARRTSALQQFIIVAFGVYLVTASLSALGSDSVWGVAIIGLLGAIVWWASYTMKQAAISALGSALVAIAFIYLWSTQGWSSQWMFLGLAAFMTAWLYPLYTWFVSIRDNIRASVNMYVLWAVLAIAVFVSFFNEETKILAAVAIITLAATIVHEATRRNDSSLKETAFYLANFGILRLIGITYPELNAVFYAHWSAIAVGAMALWRQTNRRERLYIALGLVTLVTGFYALSEGGMYQLLFLAEHVVLLVAGALLKKNWAMLWGLIATSVAVMYFLREVAYLWLGFLGLVVIGVVIWQLARKQNN